MRPHTSSSFFSLPSIILLIATSLGAAACSGKTLDVGTANDPNGTGGGSAESENENANNTGNGVNGALGAPTTAPSSSSSCDGESVDGPWKTCITSNGLLARYQSPLIYTTKHEASVVFTGVHNTENESANFDIELSSWTFPDGGPHTFPIQEMSTVWGTQPPIEQGKVLFRRYESRYDTNETTHWAAVGGSVVCELVASNSRILCRFHDVEFKDSPNSGASTKTSKASGWIIADFPR